MNRVDGKAALITGGGSGIGRATCKLLAAAGARVVVTDIDEEQATETASAIRESGGDAVSLRLDVSNEADWARVADVTKSNYGGLDVLVNNAGITVAKECSATTLDDWQAVMDVNLTGAFLGARAAIGLMTSSETYGSIVNVSSIAGMIGDNPVAYSASKGGMRLLTKSLAVECGRKGYPIRVNTVYPGSVETPMNNVLPEKVTNDLKSLYPLKRFATPLEIAKGILFLASDDSSFITGSDLVIDGGATAGCGGLLIDLPLD